MLPPRQSLWVSFSVSVIAICLLLWMLFRESDTARRRVDLEDQARAQMALIAEAQTTYHKAHGRYGWLSELRAERLILPLALRKIDGQLTATSPHYRIDVLLPRASTVGTEIALALHGTPGRSSSLEREHYAVVARPWGTADGGWRTFYLDETNAVFVNEGVSDPLTRVDPPLPEARIPENGRASPNGMRWWRLDALPPR